MSGQKEDKLNSREIERIGKVVKGTLDVCSLKLSAPLGIVVEEVEQGEYTSIDNGTFARDSHTIIVNSRWFKNVDENEIKYSLRYEARRLYQQDEVELLKALQLSGKSLSKSGEDTLHRWADKQKCVIDAFAFATAIEAIENMGADGTLKDALKGIKFRKKKSPEMKKAVEDAAREMIESISSEEQLHKFHDFFSVQRMDLPDKKMD